MELRFSTILPVLGLLLFTLVTIRSAKLNEYDAPQPRKYYWWSSLRLDSDPLDQHRPAFWPCPNDPRSNCANWDLLPNQSVVPSVFDRAFISSAFPAFLVGTSIVALCSKRGVDEVLTFMVSMPILLFGWYFLVGWILDWLLARRKRAPETPLKLT